MQNAESVDRFIPINVILNGVTFDSSMICGNDMETDISCNLFQLFDL